ncbi:hypothetical protein SK128_015918 [Halocaridina rubra]|uniref:Uncharacterized protein n=1 Tax=Halocaridina rubra TaxID=373956 RepID=A0AAN9AG40_HALRR
MGAISLARSGGTLIKRSILCEPNTFQGHEIKPRPTEDDKSKPKVSSQEITQHFLAVEKAEQVKSQGEASYDRNAQSKA